ncbi:MAG: endolytic transglycosylase MltG [Polyangiales bacterium]
MNLKRALFALAALVAIAVAALAWLVVVYPSQPPKPGASKTVALQLAPGSSLDAVADQLAHAHLIDEPRVFALYARVLGAEARLRSGQVLVTSQMTIRQLLQRIATGFGSTPLLITIPEGWNRFDVAQRLGEWGVCSAEEFLAADHASSHVHALDPSAANSEGYLFPDTYWLRDGMRAEQVLTKLTDNAQRRIGKLLASEADAVTRLQSELGFGPREIVTLASIVEKEAHTPDERPLIAGVFLNRLRDPSFRPKRLQADPTVAYGCFARRDLASCTGFDGKRVTRVMTGDLQNTFNTYRLEGLPPGPIANPGLSALRAVLRPAEHNYLYFVARGDGRHTFSTNLEAHNLAVHSGAVSAAP